MTALLVVGFFVTLVLAWYHGEEGRQRVSGPELLMVAALLVVAGAAIALVRDGGAPDPGSLPGDGSASSAEEVDATAIAVLPFENRSADPENAFFTDGIHDDLITQLFKVGALRVTSRTSVMEYRERPQNMREIGRELGVAYLVEGAVQRAGDRVRVSIQLINARSDEHLWAEDYDRNLTVENLLAIQGEIAQRVARELRATITPAEQARIAALPTEDLAAYDCYLRANMLARSNVPPRPPGAFAAHEEYECAVERDPRFAEAWARMAMVRSTILFAGFIDDRDRSWAHEALERAETLAPEAVETRMARGWLAYHELDYERALEELRAAERLVPSDVDVVAAIGAVLRRAGRWEESTPYRERSAELNPRSANAWAGLVSHYSDLRRPADARRVLERARALTFEPAVFREFGIALSLEGDTVGARAVLERDGSTLTTGEAAVLNQFLFAARGQWDEAARAMELSTRNAGRFTQRRWVDTFQLTAIVNALAGRPDEFRAWADSAVAISQEDVDRFRDSTSPYLLAGALGYLASSLAIRGDTAEAVTLAEEAVALYPMSRDAFYGPDFERDRAVVYAWVGHLDDAVALLARLLAIPSEVTVADLRFDPIWEPLRGHPGFQRLVGEGADR